MSEKYQCRSTLFNRNSLKLQAIYKKRDSGTGAFLKILRNTYITKRLRRLQVNRWKIWLDILQWNLFIADILYSGYLSTADTFLENGWNPGQTLIIKPLCSEHFIADTILRSQLNFSPITDLLIEDRQKYWSSKKKVFVFKDVFI